ncbi:MAG: hypothetical protein JWQ24_5316 [Tardiphaga sp.]|nr:hypothetical protein [Tardiphaga sp.]
MVSKWSQEERRRRKAELAAQPSAADVEMLELMRRLRPYVSGCELLDNPRAVACHALWREIEIMAEVITGNPQYFWDLRNSHGD